MEGHILLLTIALGLLFGSFLNVVIHRLPREGLSPNHPRRSFCPRCGAEIRWYDNIPVVSYLALLARCRSCRAPIPLRYFVVEVLTPALLTLVVWRSLDVTGSLAVAAAYGGLLLAMIACTFIDLEHQILPDAIDLPGMALAPVVSGLVWQLHRQPDFSSLLGRLSLMGGGVEAFLSHPRVGAVLASILGIVVGVGLILAVRLLGRVLFRKEAMGLGDVKYLGMIGGYIGWDGVLLAFLVAILVGAAVGVLIKLVTKESYMPFGPFLTVGALSVILCRAELNEFIFETYPRAVRGLMAALPAGSPLG